MFIQKIRAAVINGRGQIIDKELHINGEVNY